MKFCTIFVWLTTLAVGNGALKVQQPTNLFENKSFGCSSYAEGVAIPHQRDCQQFYVCLNRTFVQLHCENNQHFNVATMSCAPGPCQKDVVKVTKVCPANTNALRRVKDNCHAFAWCYNGAEEQFQCAAGYYFDSTNAKCQIIQNTASFKCSCYHDEFTVIANDEDCQTFYTCVNGQAFLQRCAYGFYFNNKVRACFPDVENVCSKTKTLRALERTTSDVCQRSDANKDIFQANSRHCDRFFLCLKGEVFEENCPKGFYFDSSRGYCRLDVFGICTTPFFGPQIEFQSNEHFDNEQKASAEQSTMLVVNENIGQEYESVNKKPIHYIVQTNNLKDTVQLPTLQQKPSSHVYEKLLSKFIYS